MKLSEFNALEPGAAAQVVRVWADIPDWVQAVVDARPFASADALADHAEALAGQWQQSDLDQALAQHPRIGQRVAGEGDEAESSRREQASMAGADEALTVAMAAANRSYEEKFGRVFLIRAAGRGPQEMLSELQRRLGNTHPAESSEALGQLAEIALLRLRGAISEG